VHLEIRLLGVFEARLGGEIITDFESAKIRGLLAYLASEAHHPNRREFLAELFWPDWPQKSALSNLRHVLAELRKNIRDQEAEPSFLKINRSFIQLNLLADCWVDLI